MMGLIHAEYNWSRSLQKRIIFESGKEDKRS